MSDLLCRVAHDAPHLIVYPAVVGYSSGKDIGKEEGTRDGNVVAFFQPFLIHFRVGQELLFVNVKDLCDVNSYHLHYRLVRLVF